MYSWLLNNAGLNCAGLLTRGYLKKYYSAVQSEVAWILWWGTVGTEEPYAEGWLWIIYGFSTVRRVSTPTPELFKGPGSAVFVFVYLPYCELQGNSDCCIHCCGTPPPMLTFSFSHHFLLSSPFFPDISPLTLLLMTFLSLWFSCNYRWNSMICKYS